GVSRGNMQKIHTFPYKDTPRNSPSVRPAQAGHVPADIQAEMDALGAAIDDLWAAVADKRRTDTKKKERDVQQKARRLLELLLGLEVRLWKAFAEARRATRASL